LPENEKEPEVLKKIKDLISSSVEVRVSNTPINPPTNTLIFDNLERFYCGVCGGQNIECVSSGVDGTIAGGYRWYEFLCKDCGKYTEYEHEWG
jgi:hypothetical protein